jgi:hypothetical protein
MVFGRNNNCFSNIIKRKRKRMADNNSAEDILRVGLFLVGYKGSMDQSNLALRLTRFRAHFGVGPNTAIAVWKDLVQNDAGSEKLDPAKFLVTMLWFKSYDTDSRLVSYLQVNEKTVRNYYMKYTAAIQALKIDKVCYEILM